MAHGTLLDSDARRRIRRVFGLFAVMMTALLFGLTGPAGAQDPTVSQDSNGVVAGPGGRDGITNAKRAGIYVDRAVEDMMALAPKGSCYNDPTLPTCKKSRAVVYAPEMFGWKPAAKGARKANRIRANAAQIPAGMACALKVNYGSPYYAAGYAQEDAQNICRAGAWDLDIFLRMQKYYNGSWYNMGDGRWFYPLVAYKWWYGSYRYLCTAYPTRTWHGEAFGYVMWEGIRYGGYNDKYSSVECG